MKYYLNGSQVTTFATEQYPSRYATFDWMANGTQCYIGGLTAGARTLDAYLTEFNFIDGQALTPSSFGETDAITGRWKAKAYSGTYGTNGFYLKFSDNSSLTTSSNVGIGKDFSGNTNYWATNNLSITAGAGNDSLVDSPTNYGTDSYSTSVDNARGNYCTLNPLGPKVGLEPTSSGYGIAGAKDGNLVAYAQAGGSALWISATQSMTTGKWYWEQTLNDATYAHDGVGIKEVEVQQNTTNYWWFLTIDGFFVFKNNGDKKTGSTSTSISSSLSAGNVIGVAFDADNSKLWFSVNGTWLGSGVPSSGTNPAFSSSNGITTSKSYVPVLACCGNEVAGNNVWACNFGQRPFAYTAPSGFKTLCTTNLTTPTIKKPSTAMDVVTYTGTGASNSISSLGFSPDFAWIKNRGGATSHALYDSVRGVQAQLSSDTTGSEVTSSTGLTAFDASGFTIGTSSLVNTNGTQYVAWSWDAGSTTSTNTSGSITSTVRANPQAGFSIVSFTDANVSNYTIGHGLGIAPAMIIEKNRTGGAENWLVYHKSTGATGALFLDTTNAFTSNSAYFNNISPTASVFTLGAYTGSKQRIAYCFAEIEGYSKFGSYTGNGSSDGPFVWCGFRPRWVMIKRSDASSTLSNWYMCDSARNTYNVGTNFLNADTSKAENIYADNSGGSFPIDFLSNGFKYRLNNSGGDVNASGGTYIFAAFAEAPFKYARAR